MKNTQIEWAENTINFYVGCTKVSPGCAYCYADRIETRFGRDFNIVRHTNWDSIKKNLKNWKPSKIFVNSMSDSFHDDISNMDLFDMFMIMFENPQHTYIILTKRIERLKQLVDEGFISLPSNFWIGVSVENKYYVDRIELLKTVNAQVRFVSFEPLLGDIQHVNLEGIHWIIVGGESDPSKPRLMKPEWVDSLKQAATLYGTAFFFKQWGGKTKCKCHNAWGCRMYNNKLFNEFPKEPEKIDLDLIGLT